MVSSKDRQIFQQHVDLVRAVELELKSELQQAKDKQAADSTPAPTDHAVPQLPPNVQEQNDNMPLISRMQTDLMVNSLMSDFTRVATMQITNSVGNPRMRWLDIDEGHHTISHEPDSNEDAYEQLIKINTRYSEQLAYMAKKLKETPEPGGDGNMLDHTCLLYTSPSPRD